MKGNFIYASKTYWLHATKTINKKSQSSLMQQIDINAIAWDSTLKSMDNLL